MFDDQVVCVTCVPRLQPPQQPPPLDALAAAIPYRSPSRQRPRRSMASGCLLILVLFAVGLVGVVVFLATRSPTPMRRSSFADRELYAAVHSRSIEAVRQSMQSHPDASAQFDGGDTPLHVLASYGMSPEDLPDSSMSYEQRQRRDNADALRLLLSTGVSVDVVDDSGETALQKASTSSAPGMLEGLLAAHADPNHRDRYGQTPMFWADPEKIHALVAAGGTVNVQAKDGRTPLHVAAAGGFLDIVQALVVAGATVNVRDTEGLTPLGRAELSDRQAVATYLRSVGSVK